MESLVNSNGGLLSQEGTSANRTGMVNLLRSNELIKSNEFTTVKAGDDS